MYSHDGIIDPPIDDLLDKVESKYALVIYASKRARQINEFNQQQRKNQELPSLLAGDYVEELPTGIRPVVDYDEQDKELSIALRELVEGKLELRSGAEVAAARAAAAVAQLEGEPVAELAADEAVEEA